MTRLVNECNKTLTVRIFNFTFKLRFKEFDKSFLGHLRSVELNTILLQYCPNTFCKHNYSVRAMLPFIHITNSLANIFHKLTQITFSFFRGESFEYFRD